MKIQIWKRRNKGNNKYNLYLRYRINQNKAKVESMKLWEWIKPSNNIQEEHNESIKKASKEIIRRVKDDIENDRIKINFKNKKTYLKNDFLAHTEIKNKEAVYKFVSTQDTEINNKLSSDINLEYLDKIKKYIEINIKDNKIKNTTASKYWSDFKKGLKQLNKKNLCDYPRLGSIKINQKNRKPINISNEGIKALNSLSNKKFKGIRDMFIISVMTGIKVGELSKVKWGDLVKESEVSFTLKIKERYVKLNNETRNIMGRRKNKDSYIFKSTANKSSRSKLFSKMIEEAQLNKNIKMADAVHTFANNLYRETRNIYLVSAYLGDKSIKHTKKKYKNMNEEEYLVKNDMISINKKQETNFSNKILFKKGNLFSYKKDTL
tara:strand:+ start:14870 stop:16003 length:1134 start_codon:yes stop_codon:yes gene_type:complete